MRPLILQGFRIRWDEVPAECWYRNLESLQNTEEVTFRSPVVLFAGENASGKSTLLEAIAVAYGFNPEGGSRNYSFSTYDSHADLYVYLTLLRSPGIAEWGWFLRAESFYNVATKEEDYSRGPGGDPQHYHMKSHGESFLTAMQKNIGGRSLYLFDEPEAALSPQAQLTLILEIHRAVQEGSQFIIATHSPILLGYPDAQIFSFDGPLHECAYEETGSYRITKLFLERKEQFLKELLEENMYDETGSDGTR